MNLVKSRGHDIYNSYVEKSKALIQKKLVSEPYIEKIKEICLAANSQFHLIVIPEVPNIGRKILDVYPELFERLDFQTPENLTEEDFDPDWHFNHIGHQKYAHFIDKIARK
jgi:hypothetical protein